MKEKNKKTNWGGEWTELKLQAFEGYVNAYLTIMNAQKKKHNGWPTTIYFDGFAGSGNRYSSDTENDSNSLFTEFNDYFLEKGNELYKGSAERVLSLEKKFDEYYFVDADEFSIKELKDKLKSKNLTSNKCEFINNDVKKELIKLSNYLDKNKAALVLLDPFGMQVQWSSLETLNNKRVDLWILLPSGVIINRLLDNKGELKHIETLTTFFGLEEKQIREYFYSKQIELTLFGGKEIVQKTNDSINKIATLYIERLRTLFQYVTKEPLKLLNSKNVPIYHFIFASNNQKALKIANQIIERKNQ